MVYYWLVITLSCLSGASLQIVNGDTDAGFSNPLITFGYPPLPYTNYFNSPSRNDFEYTNDIPIAALKQLNPSNEEQTLDLKRNRRMIDQEKKVGVSDWRWQSNVIDFDKANLPIEEKEEVPFLIQNLTPIIAADGNSTEGDYDKALEKRNFSPWGGKRDGGNMEHLWTWKRASNIREPSMPKRVRFSPWGGKRSGQIIYKTGNKGSKIIFSTSIPELTRIVTNYSPNGEQVDLKGFQFVPARDKRHPIKILALSTKVDERTLREALPYKTFIESLPRIFKPGHTYTDVSLKTDGKRKVKFSAWGGKRSPPIIGPIWTPTPQNMKESTINAILVIRDNHDIQQATSKQL